MLKILFISPEAFGYYNKIIKGLNQAGYSVDWLHQIPSENPFVKGFIRLFPSLGEKLSNRYFNNNIEWNKSYDIVLVIKGEGLSSEMLEKLRKTNSAALFVFYNWDSFENSKSAIKKLRFFDTVKSFDSYNAKKMSNVELLPLFHSIDDKDARDMNSLDYSSFFAGTVHSNRFSKINELSKLIQSVSKKPSFLFFFYPSRLIFLVNKLFKKEFRDIPISSISFKKRTTEDLIDKMKSATVVVDICNENQHGLTMRTIEAVGLRKKLITNNKEIVNYPFYHCNNVLITEGLTSERLKEFLDCEYVHLNIDVYQDLYVENWVKKLIDA
ncbi:hypothetical protein [Alteromonas sp. W364]|uniref:hypothetical protein n=1 Tax=Alteromonas sp. W364 TaxID=3075610 RepID=UPI002887D42C|nr:hypothetical protein [Alteromonas sp. W364]MDT0627737.1 hypothetical protein [Alteromonas sp. W364]